MMSQITQRLRRRAFKSQIPLIADNGSYLLAFLSQQTMVWSVLHAVSVIDNSRFLCPCLNKRRGTRLSLRAFVSDTVQDIQAVDPIVQNHHII